MFTTRPRLSAFYAVALLLVCVVTIGTAASSAFRTTAEETGAAGFFPYEASSSGSEIIGRHSKRIAYVFMNRNWGFRMVNSLWAMAAKPS